MTVSSTLNKIIYLGDNVTTSFTFPFPGAAASDIEVFITDSAGTITQLATNLYSVTLNAAISPNPTSIGGAVNYPLSGPPLALGNTLTILRTLPLTQPTSLTAQGTSYQTVIEGALDNVTMEVQQLNELLGRQITVAVSDPTPGDLPPVAQRANLLMGFDSNGDPAAVALPAGSVSISSAMIPVVGAATLASARTLLGLGSIATLGVGTGLISDGTNVNVSSNSQVISANHNISASENNNHHFATVALNVILPTASTCFNGWVTYITALTDSVAVQITPTDSFYGSGVGQAFTVNPGKSVKINTDGVSTWFASFTECPSPGVISNLRLNASVAGNNLTISIKNLDGFDPSPSSPVILAFAEGNSSLGITFLRTITAPLSIVVPNGASLGTVNGIASRVWVTAFDNAGTIVLGVYNSVASNGGIKSFDTRFLAATTAISAGATAAQTHYTSSGVGSKQFVILGSVDITEATAGQWATAPVFVSVFAIGDKTPGDVVQSVYATNAGTTTSAGVTPTATGLTLSITPTSAANIIKVRADGNVQNPPVQFFVSQLYRGAATQVGNRASGGSGAGIEFPVSLFCLDIPSTLVSTAYTVYIWSNGGNSVWNSTLSTTTIYAEEIYA